MTQNSLAPGARLAGPSLGRQMLSKVPQVTLIFWIIKIMSTTVGETAADFLSDTLGLGLTLTSLVMGALLAAALAFQLRARKYVPGLYWLVVVLISVVGTLITDNLVDNLGVPLWTTTVIFAIALAVTFIVWYRFEGTLSIHSITTARREVFYWTAILFAFALGTAAGDLLAEGLDIGYLNSLILFGGLIAAVTVGYYRFHLNAVLAFWVAYVLTRPLGASLGDLVTQPTADGGLGLGTTTITTTFLVAIIGLVTYLSITHKDDPTATTDTAAGHPTAAAHHDAGHTRPRLEGSAQLEPEPGA